jgi:hypothetical protein
MEGTLLHVCLVVGVCHLRSVKFSSKENTISTSGT